ncbi:MAG: beta-phosphoglucomutase family hydrolase [Actinomycetales bacterium]|nr:beta-phosphoglucomutase family hydrolase [Actinomycetales bacterium]
MNWNDFDAALFDLDGVLTPTAELHQRAWFELFTEYLATHPSAPAYTQADYFAHVDGRPRYDGVAAMLASRGIELPWGTPADSLDADTVCGLGNRKNQQFEELLARDGILPYPGSLKLVEQLHAAGTKLAVVSSSRNAVEVLRIARIDHFFPVVVDGKVAEDDNVRGKPAPDMFLKAAARLGVEPARAVVLEDAVSGVQSGAAGDFGLVVGVDRGAGHQVLTQAGANLVVDDLEELL